MQLLLPFLDYCSRRGPSSSWTHRVPSRAGELTLCRPLITYGDSISLVSITLLRHSRQPRKPIDRTASLANAQGCCFSERCCHEVGGDRCLPIFAFFGCVQCVDFERLGRGYIREWLHQCR